MSTPKKKRKFKPCTTPQGKTKVNYTDSNGKQFSKILPNETKINELFSIFGNNNKVNYENYLIYINGKAISDTNCSFEDLSCKFEIELKFEINPIINCIFYSLKHKEGQKIDFNINESENFQDILQVGSNCFYIFNSKGETEKIDNENYKQKLERGEKYYLVQYGSILEQMHNNYILNESLTLKKEFFNELISQLNISIVEFRQLLCILYKIDQTDSLKKQFLKAIQELVFIPISITAKQFFSSATQPMICRTNFLLFIFSIQILKADSKSYINIFEELFQITDQSKSPFAPLVIRKLFFIQNVVNNLIIQINDREYGIFLGPSEDEPNKSKYYDPYEDEIEQFDFADYFLKALTKSSKTINIEDIFFNTNEYQFTEKVIGKGAFSRVVIVKRTKDDKEYAAKIVDTNNEFNGRDQKLFMRESIIFQKLQHPSILNFIGINFQSYEHKKIMQPTIITEYMEKGSLLKIIKNEEIKKWSSTKIYILLLGIINAMRYLHMHGIIHRDLKLDNVLIDQNDYARICDFGNSRSFPDALHKSMELIKSGEFGTPIYLAPELIEDVVYGPSVDVYSFSILAYEIIAKKRAYDFLKTKSSFTLLCEIQNGIRPILNESFSDKMKDLLKKCWSADPYDRPTFDEIWSQLSTDFSYSKEKVDSEVIQNYIKKLEQIPESPNQVILNHIKYDVNDIENIFFDTSDYTISHDLIESGIYSSTYLATGNKDNKKYSAVVINTDLFKGYDQMLIIRESILFSKLKHSFIMKFYGVNLQSFKDKRKIKPTMITEYIGNKTLSEIIKKLKHYNKSERLMIEAKILLGVASAMKVIHENGIVHGFISPNNIFIDDNFYPRIRLPYSFSENNDVEKIINCGCQRYFAPEIYDLNNEYGFGIDIYAFGILTYEIFTNHEAYQNCPNSLIITKKIEGYFEWTYDLPYEINNLVGECMNIKVEKRPSFNDIFNMLFGYFENFDEISDLLEELHGFL